MGQYGFHAKTYCPETLCWILRPSWLHENLPGGLPPLEILMDPHHLGERVRVVDPDVYLVPRDGVEELCAPLLELPRRADISHQRALAGPNIPYVLCCQLRGWDGKRDSGLFTLETYPFMRDPLTAAP
jgi:hypothetical protein